MLSRNISVVPLITSKCLKLGPQFRNVNIFINEKSNLALTCELRPCNTLLKCFTEYSIINILCSCYTNIDIEIFQSISRIIYEFWNTYKVKWKWSVPIEYKWRASFDYNTCVAYVSSKAYSQICKILFRQWIRCFDGENYPMATVVAC